MKIHYEGFMREKIQRNPVTINDDASFYEAQALIHEKGVRHLPVMDKHGKLAGLVTDYDVRKAAPSDATSLSVSELKYLLGKLKVAAFMTPKEKLFTINPDTLIEEAVNLMHDHKIGCLPVLDGDKLYGIFTESDALEALVGIFGLKKKGTRLSITVVDKPGALLGALEVIKRHEINIISIVSPSFKFEENKRIFVIRIQTEDYKELVEDLEKAGYDVLSIGKWPLL